MFKWIHVGLFVVGGGLGMPFMAEAGAMGVPFLINPVAGVSGQPTEQWDERAASNGQGIWLLVWADNGSKEIYGMRLDAQGRLLDSVALPIAPNRMGAIATERRFPSVAWFQGAFWVVWQEYRGAGSYQGYGRRVSSDGSFLDVTPFSVETTASSAYRSTVCAGATNVLMTWSTYSGGYYQLWGQTYSPEGQPVGVATQLISSLSSYLQPSMAFGSFDSGPRSYLVPYSSGGDIRGLRVAEDGRVMDSTPLAICTFSSMQLNPYPAFGRGPGGTQGWWVVWTDTRYSDYNIYGAFVSQSGSVSHSSTGLPLVVWTGTQDAPSLAWDGSRHVLGWYDERLPAAMRASVMNAEGVLADAAGALLTTTEPFYLPIGGGTNGNFLALSGYDDVYTTPFTRSGDALVLGTQRLASVSGAFESFADGICDGTNYWVLFEHHPAEGERGNDISLQALSAAGSPCFAAPIAVCAHAGDQWGPSVAVAKDTLLAVWSDERNSFYQVWGQLISRDGLLVGSNFPIATNSLYSYFCDTATDGTNFMVVWQDSIAEAIRGVMIQTNGTLGSMFTVASGSDVSDPSLTFDGGCYLVLWADDMLLRFRRYSPDGTALDGVSNLFTSTVRGSDPYAAYNPDNNRFLVTWRDQGVTRFLSRTLEASTAALGNVSTVAVISVWLSSVNCALTYDGQNWLSLFRDSRGGLDGLYGMRVQADGTALDATPFPVLRGAVFGELVAPAPPCTNVMILGGCQVYSVDGRSYNTRKDMGCFWQPGAPVAPGRVLEGRGVRTDASGQTVLSFQQSAPASTNFVVEACSSLPGQTWLMVTNLVLLDSGVGVSAVWSGGANSALVYRIIGK